MPTITVQVGQCGNQLGDSMWSLLAQQQRVLDSQIRHASLEFFCADGSPRCVAVDTEAKVVGGHHCHAAGPLLRQRHVLGHSGCGNNCNGSMGGDRPTALDKVTEGVRVEAERCDGCPDLLLLHSLAGGTGSGLGSALLEALRDCYPASYMAAASVAPSHTGDSALQSLNAALSLSFLSTYADAVMLFDNQQLLDGLTGAAGAMLSTPSGGVPRAGLADVNGVIAEGIVGALWPLHEQDTASGRSRIREMVATVCCDPCLKFVDVRTVPLHNTATMPTSTVWRDSTRQLARTLPKSNPFYKDQAATTAACLLVARDLPRAALGTGAAAAAAAVHGWNGFVGSTEDVCVQAGPGGLVGIHGGIKEAGDAAATMQSRRGGTAQPCLTGVCLHSSCGSLLRHYANRALDMCQAGAYMHWYERYGCGKDAIQEAARAVLDVASCYSWTPP